MFFPKNVGKFIFGFLLVSALACSSLFARPVQAATYVGHGYGTASDFCDKGGNAMECWGSQASVTYFLNVTCSIMPIPGADWCTEDPERFKQLQEQSGISVMNKVIAGTMTNPPASTYAFIQDTGKSLGFIPHTANAQGLGVSGLSFILPLWKAFRNIAYLILSMVLIVIGFLVMFRKKIDPKTVVTVQNALPRIVVALLLVTFSYAIVGLMIDLMYFVIFLGVNILASASKDVLGGGASTLGPLGADTASKYASGGVWNLFWDIFGGGLSSVDDFVRLLTGNNSFWQIVGWAGPGWIIGLIVSIAILFGYIRLVFTLVSAYIQILISLILAPFQLLLEAFPGSNSFAGWFNNLIANLAVFPITAIMLALGTIITRYNNPATIWTPPLLSSQGTTGVVALIGLGILLGIPSVANSVKEALKAQGAAVGPAAFLGPMGAGLGQVVQLGYQFQILTHGWQGTTPFQRSKAAAEAGPSAATDGLHVK